MSVLFCLRPEVHFMYTPFREWALLPSLGVLLLSEFVAEWKFHPELMERGVAPRSRSPTDNNFGALYHMQ